MTYVSFILCLTMGKVNDVSLFSMYVSFIYFGVGDSECIGDNCMLSVGVLGVLSGCIGCVLFVWYPSIRGGVKVGVDGDGGVCINIIGDGGGVCVSGVCVSGDVYVSGGVCVADMCVAGVCVAGVCVAGVCVAGVCVVGGSDLVWFVAVYLFFLNLFLHCAVRRALNVVCLVCLGTKVGALGFKIVVVGGVGGVGVVSNVVDSVVVSRVDTGMKLADLGSSVIVFGVFASVLLCV